MSIAASHGFEPPKKAFHGWAQQGRIGGTRILLLKPATYMNDSGRAVRAAMDFFKRDVGDVTIFHDELDLAPFKVKAKVGGGTAGHNGLRSTEAHIGNDFRRVRIGIGHPGRKEKVTGHVLGNYAKAEQDRLADMLGAIAAEAEWLAKGDDARFMNECAEASGLRLPPDRLNDCGVVPVWRRKARWKARDGNSRDEGDFGEREPPLLQEAAASVTRSSPTRPRQLRPSSRSRLWSVRGPTPAALATSASDRAPEPMIAEAATDLIAAARRFPRVSPSSISAWFLTRRARLESASGHGQVQKAPPAPAPSSSPRKAAGKRRFALSRTGRPARRVRNGLPPE